MFNSILTSVKKNLGLDVSYTAFDQDILMHINSALATLTQLGIGPENGFTVEDASTTWATIIGTDAQLNSVKTLVYLRVRLLFDPPTTGYLIDAMKEQIQELTWRISVYREGNSWIDPNGIVAAPDTVLDGGDA